jgi:hypothetical protein
MRKASNNFRRGRKRSGQQKKFWQWLGRMTLKLLVLAPLLTKLVDMALTIMKWIKG